MSSFLHKAAISLALLVVPQEILDSFPVYCSLDPEILAIFLFLESSRDFYYVCYFLIQLCNWSFCTGRLGEMRVSESLASESCENNKGNEFLNKFVTPKNLSLPKK